MGEAEVDVEAVGTGHAWHVSSESDTDRGHGVIVGAVLVVGTAMDKWAKSRIIQQLMSVAIGTAERDMGAERSPEQDKDRCDRCCAGTAGTDTAVRRAEEVTHFCSGDV